ncbi:MAG: flagellar basal body-associated FliL family protein [Deltaproteobacteria bacterium]|nr:flagellar basal body-associated FliL family protein [Deltaproteobacteria bacterium]
MADEVNDELDVKPKNNMMIIVIVAAIAVLGVGGVAAVLLINKGGDNKKAEAAAPTVDEPGQLGPLVKMDSFVVNLPTGERGLYMRAAITVELVNDLAVEPFNKWLPIMRNEILMDLSAVKITEQVTVKQKRAIEKELVVNMNKRLNAKLVKGVYFTEFITQ